MQIFLPTYVHMGLSGAATERQYVQSNYTGIILTFSPDPTYLISYLLIDLHCLLKYILRRPMIPGHAWRVSSSRDILYILYRLILTLSEDCEN
jgi:hypothetical protein